MRTPLPASDAVRVCDRYGRHAEMKKGKWQCVGFEPSTTQTPIIATSSTSAKSSGDNVLKGLAIGLLVGIVGFLVPLGVIV